MGINGMTRCSECDKIWRKAELEFGKCPLCTEIKQLNTELGNKGRIIRKKTEEIGRLNEYIFNLDKTAEKHRANFEKIHRAIHKALEHFNFLKVQLDKKLQKAITEGTDILEGKS